MSAALGLGEVEELLGNVPPLPRFLTAKELDEAALSLARQYPGTVRARRIGQTTHGDALIGLEAGEGDRTALIVGGAHPNDPVGTLTTLEVARALAEHPKAAARLGTRFFLLPALDRDGLRLNEGWLTSPFSFVRYAHHGYRPPASHQKEWCFPYFAPAYDFSAAPSETESLARLIDTLHPSLLVSLHNSTVGGVYFYLNRPHEELQSALVDTPRALGLPLEPALPSDPWGTILAPYILRAPSTHEAVQYLLHRGLDPRRVLRQGAGSIEYAESLDPRVLGLLSEVPLFADPRSGDTREASADRATLEAGRLERRSRVVNLLRSAYQTLRREGSLRPGTFRECLESVLDLPSRREGLEPVPDPPGPVTQAEVFRKEVDARVTDLRLLGTLHRFIGEQAVPGTFAREGLLRSTEDQIDSVAHYLENDLKGRRAAIPTLVKAQMGAVFLASTFR